MGGCVMKPTAIDCQDTTQTRHKSVDSGFTSSLIKLNKVKITNKKKIRHCTRSTISCEKVENPTIHTSTVNK